MRALVLKNDATTAAIEKALHDKGMATERAEDGEDAVDLAKRYDFDVIVLDALFERGSTLQALRTAGVDIPVLALVADDPEGVDYLSKGADSFLVEPFHKTALTGRVQAIVRRSGGYASSKLQCGQLEVDIDGKCARVNGTRLELTPQEYGLLELFVLRRGRIVTREAMFDHLYDCDADTPDSRSVFSIHVCRIRKKIATLTGGPSYIRTAWGTGYTLEDPAAPEVVSEGLEGGGNVKPRECLDRVDGNSFA